LQEKLRQPAQALALEIPEIAEELHRHRSRHAISEMVIFEVRAFQFPAAENQLAAGRDLKGLESNESGIRRKEKYTRTTNPVDFRSY
jgi:hypothetical protein